MYVSVIEQRVQELHQLFQYMQGGDANASFGFDASPEEGSEATSGQSGNKIPFSINRTPWVMLFKIGICYSESYAFRIDFYFLRQQNSLSYVSTKDICSFCQQNSVSFAFSIDICYFL